YSEAFNSKQEAMRAEALFKQKTRKAKLTYIKQHKNEQ
ncbi:TPA: GIY-YIG nuclease family protein, partial [Streptococcus agalactiae]